MVVRWLCGGALALAVSTGVAAAQSSCGQYDFAGPYAEAFLAGETYKAAAKAAETITNMADGACHQDQMVKQLTPALGEVAGYKAAATSAGAQKQLGLDGPVLGFLLEGMLKDDGAVVEINSGARLIFELDLMARVGSEAINDAVTRAEAKAGIDAILPFIELGDLMVPKGAAITGPLLQAMNAGARGGVVGAPVTIDGLSEAQLALASGRLTLNGKKLAEAPATALLGHPLDAVLWIVKHANARGMRLKEGDLLSLGSLGRFQLAAPGKVVATYEGFADEPITVRLTLE